MAADDAVHVRIKERLRIKIGEAKNLPGRHGSCEERDVFCTLSLDQEEIFRTATVEKTLNPLFGEEFQFEVPRDFRYISIYVFDNVKDRHIKQNKVLGKVAIKREDLTRYNNNKDYWFSIKPVDADSEVQGKVNIQLRFDTTISSKSKFGNYRANNCLAVQVIECKDLTLKNGSCDAYAVVCVTYMNGKSVSKKTKVRKKTACPKFDEMFIFTNYEDSRCKDSYMVCPESELDISELKVSLWHYSGMGEDVFLGEVRIQLQGRQQQRNALANAWYFLQPRPAANRPRYQPSTPEGTRLSCESSLGSLRLLIQYTEDYVFPAKVYEPLKNLLLQSINTNPIKDSSVYVLGEIISSQMEIAQPLVRIFMHHQQIVHIIRALAESEISRVTDTTTLFRGNTLVTAMMEQAMRLIGLQYLHKTLRPTLELIFTEKKPCEIDPAKVPDRNTLENNLATLKYYVQKIFDAITQSAVHCPPLMCQIFHSLKECAITYFPGKQDIRYLVISGFIFLRFFAPAILGPKLFDLTSQHIDQDTNRTLTLISKTIQSLGNMICRSAQSVKKEEYMLQLCNCFCTKAHIEMLSQFLEIISASSSPQTIKNDIPVTLKEGLMIKRAQGRKKFGLKNFKQRYFKLTTHDLSYSKKRDKAALCQIPLSNILAVERLEESSFKKKNMFQIVQEGRVLYIQAPNCVEQKEWVDLLTKICQTNSNRLRNYHPAAYVNGHWPCCKSSLQMAPGCQEVSKNSSNSLHATIDPERELQRVHSLIFTHNDQLEAKLKKRMMHDLEITEQKAEVIRELGRISLEIEDRHRCYKRQLSRGTKYGSLAAPIGDDNYLLASRMNLNSSVLRRPTSETGGV